MPIVPDYTHTPGNHCGSTALRNLLAFHGVEISEDDDRVRITARVRCTSSDDCPAADSVRDVVVELQEPLGDRELTGCSPRGSAAGPQPDPGPNCGA